LILYHNAYAKDRESIRERGLEARDTCRHNYGPCDESDPWPNMGVLAVYAATKPGYWARDDVWEIDATGLPVEPDPVLALDDEAHPAKRIRADVPPERIRLVSSKEPTTNSDIPF
jgi:hypothetical protein